MARPKREARSPKARQLQQTNEKFHLCSVACLVVWVVELFSTRPNITIDHIGQDWTRRSVQCAKCGRGRHISASRRLVWAGEKSLPNPMEELYNSG